MSPPKKKSTDIQEALKNFSKALGALRISLASPVTEPRDLSGIIKDFEICYELSWKTLKKYLRWKGHATMSARDAFSVAFQLGILPEEKVWLDIMEDRNQTVHVYDEAFARKMCGRVRTEYFKAFEVLYSVASKDSG